MWGQAAEPRKKKRQRALSWGILVRNVFLWSFFWAFLKNWYFVYSFSFRVFTKLVLFFWVFFF